MDKAEEYVYRWLVYGIEVWLSTAEPFEKLSFESDESLANPLDIKFLGKYKIEEVDYE